MSFQGDCVSWTCFEVLTLIWWGSEGCKLQCCADYQLLLAWAMLEFVNWHKLISIQFLTAKVEEGCIGMCNRIAQQKRILAHTCEIMRTGTQQKHRTKQRTGMSTVAWNLLQMCGWNWTVCIIILQEPDLANDFMCHYPPTKDKRNWTKVWPMYYVRVHKLHHALGLHSSLKLSLS